MNYRNRYDSHSHSTCSVDGWNTVEEMAQKALDLGLLGLAVTDHCECDVLREDPYEENMHRAAREIRAARELFGGRLELAHGLELGQYFYNPAEAERLTALYPYDIILGSLHRLTGRKAFFISDFRKATGQDLDDLLRAYLRELNEFVKWQGFDVLAHFSFPLRYIKAQTGKDVDLTRYAKEIDEILDRLAAAGRGIEINTSGLRRELRDTLPPGWIISRFRELGGKYVTIGSDAHREQDLADGLEQSMKILGEAGFTHFAFYQNRTPRLIPIE